MNTRLIECANKVGMLLPNVLEMLGKKDDKNFFVSVTVFDDGPGPKDGYTLRVTYRIPLGECIHAQGTAEFVGGDAFDKAADYLQKIEQALHMVMEIFIKLTGIPF